MIADVQLKCGVLSRRILFLSGTPHKWGEGWPAAGATGTGPRNQGKVQCDTNIGGLWEK